MLPDVSDALTEWLLPYTVKTVGQMTIDFEPADIVSSRTVQAVVQVAQKNQLSADSIDWDKRYLLVHSPSQLADGEFIEYQGEDYKIIDNGDWQLYGYTEAVAEQTKQTTLVVTHLLTYTAGMGGSITGSPVQVVVDGASGSAVTAVADTGYTFTQWSDGVLTASRTDIAVTSAISVTALFEVIP